MSGAHSPSFLLLHLCHSSLPNPSVTLPTSQLILQPLRRFTYVTAHSPTLPLLHLRHSSFSNPSFASLRHKLFTYVTWWAAHVFSLVVTLVTVVLFWEATILLNDLLTPYVLFVFLPLSFLADVVFPWTLYAVMTVDTVAQDIPTNFATIVTDAPTNWAPTIFLLWKPVSSDIIYCIST